MTAILDPWAGIPKYLRDRSDIRARELVEKGLVYENGPRAYLVAGRTKIYDVFVVGEVVRCLCPAGDLAKLCSHALAVGIYIERKKEKQ